MSHVKVYRSGRLRPVLGMVLFTALASGVTFIFPQRPALGWILAGLFGFIALVMLANLVAGGFTLTLGRKGFEITSLFRKTRIHWDEIEALQLGKLQRTEVIAINYLPGKKPHTMSRALTGLDVAIGNHYGAPLAQLCGTMNDYRDRYLGARSAARSPSASSRVDIDTAAREAAPPVAARPARIILVALAAALLVLVLNVVLRLLLKLEGMYVTIGIAFGVASLVLFWFIKVLGRAPQPAERSRLLWIYAGLIVVPYLGLFLLGAVRVGFNPWALMILVLHAIAYPAALQMFLAPKRFAARAPTTA